MVSNGASQLRVSLGKDLLSHKQMRLVIAGFGLCPSFQIAGFQRSRAHADAAKV